MAAKASTVPAAAQQGRGKSTAAMPRPTACISRAARRVLACARASRFVICRTILSFRIIIAHLPSPYKTEKADVLLQQRQNFTAILPNAL